jgi:flagellar hook-basal body complex protein FliE
MVAPIGGVGNFDALTKLAGNNPVTGATGGGDQFGQLLQNLDDKGANTEALLKQAMTGDLTDVHDYMIAAAQMSTVTELATSVRNRAIDSFNDIMRMQI